MIGLRSRRPGRAAAGLGLLTAAVCLSGCSTLRMKTEGRSATDQLLTAVSIQRAMESLDISGEVENKTVFFKAAGHGDEMDYIEALIPAYLMDQGAAVAENAEEADLNLVFVIDAAGTDTSSGGWGIPIILPSISDGFTLTTFNFIETDELKGMCRLWIYATDAEGAHRFTTEKAYAQNEVENLTLLGLSVGQRSDVEDIQLKIPVVDIAVP